MVFGKVFWKSFEATLKYDSKRIEKYDLLIGKTFMVSKYSQVKIQSTAFWRSFMNCVATCCGLKSQGCKIYNQKYF